MVPDLKIHEPHDVYRIRSRLFTDLKALDPDEKAPRFIISPNWKDTHATIIFSVVDPDTKQILTSLFLNSSNNPSYFKYTQERLIMDDHIPPPFLEKFAARDFPEFQNVPSEKKEIQVNEASRSALAINYGTLDRQLPEFQALMTNPNIDAIYQVGNYSNSKKSWLMGSDISRQPFIDVSHHLQIKNDDFNCVLYGLNFVHALVCLLREPTIAEKITALSREIAKDPTSPGREQLVTIFREQLKTYLPQYYDQNGQTRSDQEIQSFHVNERWELGSESVYLTNDQTNSEPINPSIVSIFKSKKEDTKTPIPDSHSSSPKK